jgi:hypothetical protein
MSDAFNFDPFLTGTAGGYMGNVGGYNIGAQPEPTFTTPAAPAQSFTPTETGYTPTFDFSQMFQGALPDYGMPAAGYQTPQTNFSNPADYPAFNAAPAAGRVRSGQPFQPPGEGTVTPQLQSLFQQAGQALPGVVGQFAGPKGADATSGLYDTSGQSDQQQATGGLSDLLKNFGGLKGLTSALGGLLGYAAQQKAVQQAQEVGQQIKDMYAKSAADTRALAQPLYTAGTTQFTQAQQGILSAAQQQAIQAQRAQLAQAAEKTGGVGAIQTAAAEQRFYEQALSNDITNALAVLGAADPMMTSAIQQELQGSVQGLTTTLQYTQQANAAAANLYKQLAGMGASTPQSATNPGVT